MLGRIALLTTLVLVLISARALTSSALLIAEDDNAQMSSASRPVQLPELTTNVWGIFDPTTGAVIMGDNMDTVHSIASVTKLFTAYTAVKSTKAHAPTIITWSDVNTEGGAGKLFYGERTTPTDLLFPLLIESSNDAAEAIHRVIGSEFENTILTLKSALSLDHTQLDDASGLSNQNVSSVKDLARFYSFLRKEEPHLIDITQLNVYITDNGGLVNNNPARTLTHFSGGKHGYTEFAGRTFVGTFHLPSTKREIGIVLLGSTNMLRDVETVLAYASTQV